MCGDWKVFIERVNSQIKIEKRIRVINMTLYNNFGYCTHPLIKIFDKYIHSCYECRIVTTEDDQDSVVEMIHQLNGVAVI